MIVEQLDAISASIKYPESITLIFASHKRPGGAWERHEKGQEEYIARRSNLVTRLAPYLYLYGDNRKPFHIVLNEMELTGNHKRDFIVSHAPVAHMYDDPKKVIEERIIEICKLVSSYDTFITGPFGCGFFGNEEKHVRELFEEHAKNDKVIWLEYRVNIRRTT